MPEHVQMANNWEDARRLLESLRPDLPISFGTGNPIYRPYVRAVHLDADAGEGQGYRVAIKPLGDGYGKPADYFLIYLATSKNYAYHRPIIPQMAVSEANSKYLLQNNLVLSYCRKLILAAS